MYMYQTIKGADAVEFCETKLELDPSEYDMSTVTRVEIFTANRDDDGDDFFECRVIDKDDTVIALRRALSF